MLQDVHGRPEAECRLRTVRIEKSVDENLVREENQAENGQARG
jgi:hypothetical protein